MTERGALYAALKGRSSTKGPRIVQVRTEGGCATPVFEPSPGAGVPEVILKNRFQNRFVPPRGLVKMYYSRRF